MMVQLTIPALYTYPSSSPYFMWARATQFHYQKSECKIKWFRSFRRKRTLLYILWRQTCSSLPKAHYLQVFSSPAPQNVLQNKKLTPAFSTLSFLVENLRQSFKNTRNTRKHSFHLLLSGTFYFFLLIMPILIHIKQTSTFCYSIICDICKIANIHRIKTHDKYIFQMIKMRWQKRKEIIFQKVETKNLGKTISHVKINVYLSKTKISKDFCR